jgi:hypothetical protein
MPDTQPNEAVLRGMALACAALLFIALLRLPIGYYTFLRLAVTVGAVTFIYHHARRSGLGWWVLVFGALALLFNPIWPVYLGDRSLWAPINILGGAVFLVAAWFVGRKRRES